MRVKKKDGEYEAFSEDKLINSIAKSGVSIAHAQKIAKEVVTEITTGAGDDVLDSVLIREHVITKLAKAFPLEAESYKTYSKT